MSANDQQGAVPPVPPSTSVTNHTGQHRAHQNTVVLAPSQADTTIVPKLTEYNFPVWAHYLNIVAGPITAPDYVNQVLNPDEDTIMDTLSPQQQAILRKAIVETMANSLQWVWLKPVHQVLLDLKEQFYPAEQRAGMAFDHKRSIFNFVVDFSRPLESWEILDRLNDEYALHEDTTKLTLKELVQNYFGNVPQGYDANGNLQAKCKRAKTSGAVAAAIGNFQKSSMQGPTSSGAKNVVVPKPSGPVFSVPGLNLNVGSSSSSPQAHIANNTSSGAARLLLTLTQTSPNAATTHAAAVATPGRTARSARGMKPREYLAIRRMTRTAIWPRPLQTWQMLFSPSRAK